MVTMQGNCIVIVPERKVCVILVKKAKALLESLNLEKRSYKTEYNRREIPEFQDNPGNWHSWCGGGRGEWKRLFHMERKGKRLMSKTDKKCYFTTVPAI